MTLKASVNYLKKFIFTTFKLSITLLFEPLVRLEAVWNKPKSFFATLVVGPVIGLSFLLTRPKGLIVGALLGLAVGVGFPSLALSVSIAVGVASNFLTSFFDSVVQRIENQEKFNKKLDKNDQDNDEYAGLGFSYIMRGLREKRPDNLTPIAQGLYFDYISANKWATPGNRPYNAEDFDGCTLMSGWVDGREKPHRKIKH